MYDEMITSNTEKRPSPKKRKRPSQLKNNKLSFPIYTRPNS
ncbi:hypothetical protein SAMN05444349_10178 [Bacteroides faecichinchillae]|uniref:Uncharacterized protein n=1 Tax=Bacteroides faecichinchillae TaxID=871325 RepID=A0A1M4SCD6_9BACE|nr:hypothetical protein SAMN05444349_10178 [Bacteroides faecichinchillae]